jgi:REP element-mobilizing transposase RayT
MARRKTSFLTGHYYHIFNRGANKELIFREAENYHFLLRRVKEASLKFQAAIIAYCLMPNHYHFMLRQDGELLISQFIQGIFNSYSKAFNKAFQRTGTLFEGPYKAVHIDKEDHLLHLCRYIHRNPLEAGLVNDLSDWPYSNYLEWVGKRSGILFDAKFVKAHFIDPDEYERFVLDYIPTSEENMVVQKLSFEDNNISNAE